MGDDARRLVFGDDGSRGADVAWLWVNNHPWPGWRIDVLTGADPPYGPSAWGVAPTLEEWASPWGRAYLNASAPAVVSHWRANSDPRLLLDEQSDADVVVVGDSERGHLRSLLMGSTAEWLLHHPSAPLAIVRTAVPVQRVVCCLDGSDSASRALDAFLALPLAVDAEVTLLSVDDGRVDVDRAIDTAVAALGTRGVDARIERLHGKPTAVIIDHLKTTQPQLVVLGTKGLTGWRRLRLGSTAAGVVHNASCTCLVACAESVDDDHARA